MPLLTMLHVATDLTLTVLGLLHPIYALAGSVTLVCGWAVQVGFWTECDLPANLENSAGSCYQSQLQKDSRTGDPTGVSTALANAKVAFAFLTFFL